MNVSNETARPGAQMPSPTLGSRVRQFPGGRRGLILLAIVILGAAMYFNWGWLAAAGVAPLILLMAPCAVMCALGLCMNRGDKSSSTQSPAGPGKKG